MSQTISAFYYIRNNKRRVAVLSVSLAMFFLINYLSMFLLSTTSETFRSALTETTKCVQYIRLGEEDLAPDYSDPGKSPSEIYMDAVTQKFEQIAPRIAACSGVEEVFVAQVEYTYIASVVGNYYVEVPLADKEQMRLLLDRVDGKLVDGRMPKQANEVVLDVRSMKNYGYALGDALSSNRDVKVVGVIDCGYYFGCGLAEEGKPCFNPEICVIVDGSVEDLRAALAGEGIALDHSDFIDYREGEKELKQEIVDVIASSTNLLFAGFVVIVSVLVVIVDISYMRDRRSEWCLYASIGYARRTIYFSMVRELLFTFASGITGAAAVTALAMKLLDVLVVEPLGLRCRYFLPDTLFEILCAYAALFGIMQLPVRLEMCRIRTIDAIDDEL